LKGTRSGASRALDWEIHIQAATPQTPVAAVRSA
jgi:hypothetical protein